MLMGILAGLKKICNFLHEKTLYLEILHLGNGVPGSDISALYLKVATIFISRYSEKCMTAETV